MTYYLIDYENIKLESLEKIPNKIRLWIFMGATQKNIDADLIIVAAKRDIKIKFIKACGQGKNAIDMHIAFSMGKLIHKHKNISIVVVSKDKGFDPLIKYLKEEGYCCERVDAVNI